MVSPSPLARFCFDRLVIYSGRIGGTEISPVGFGCRCAAAALSGELEGCWVGFDSRIDDGKSPSSFLVLFIRDWLHFGMNLVSIGTDSGLLLCRGRIGFRCGLWLSVW